nr:hypothetical protein GCM10020093_094500 [Planobispora longispora]
MEEGWGAWLVSRGDVGVAIFFTLSGLLLYRPWATAALTSTAPPSAKAYLWRRGFRLLPAYWLVAVIALLLFNQAHNDSQWFWAKWLLLLQIYDVESWWLVGRARAWSRCGRSPSRWPSISRCRCWPPCWPGSRGSAAAVPAPGRSGCWAGWPY